MPTPASHLKFVPRKGYAVSRGFATNPRIHWTAQDQASGGGEELEAEDGESW